jgi:hypothetical protein
MYNAYKSYILGDCHEINPFDGHCANFRIYRKMVWTILRYTR